MHPYIHDDKLHTIVTINRNYANFLKLYVEYIFCILQVFILAASRLPVSRWGGGGVFDGRLHGQTRLIINPQPDDQPAYYPMTNPIRAGPLYCMDLLISSLIG